jgi:hypothetical protein
VSEGLRGLLGGLLFACFAASVVAAQTVVVAGSYEDTTTSALRQMVERGGYLLLERDTVLSAADTIPGDVVIVEARVTVEGLIRGSVAVVDGDLFVRPGAVVSGPIIAVLGRGGAYLSTLAEVPRSVYMPARVRVSVRRTAGTLTVTIDPPPPIRSLRPKGILGFGPPTYDRVNGLSPTWGLEARFGGIDTALVTIGAHVGYRGARGDVDGTVTAAWRPSSRMLLLAEAGRASRTVDSWIRDDISNSAAALLVQSDIRDYHESDEVALTIVRTAPPPLLAGEWFVVPRLGLHLSRDRSLVTANTWSLFEDDEGWRENPPIDEGTLASAVGGLSAAWRGLTAGFSGDIAAEWAPGEPGDFEFAQLTAQDDFSMLALWNHQIDVTAYGRLPLGGREAPLQRWSHIGGAGTLPTFPDASMRGDHVVFIRSRYFARIPPIQFPLLGEPSLRLEHAIGVAWRTDAPRPPFEQNAGVGLQLSMFNIMLFVDPAEDPLEVMWKVGAQLPGSLRP